MLRRLWWYSVPNGFCDEGALRKQLKVFRIRKIEKKLFSDPKNEIPVYTFGTKYGGACDSIVFRMILPWKVVEKSRKNC
jgi:hypothetical protein